MPAPPAEAPRFRPISASGGCLIILVAGSVLLLCIGLVLITVRKASPPMVVAPPRPVPVPEMVQPPEREQAVPRRSHHVTHEFKVDELWIPRAELPLGLEASAFPEGADLLKAANLPPAIESDLEYSRGIVFQKGCAMMVGLQFKSEFARRRWKNDPRWSREMEHWHYWLGGDSQAVILIRHDGSPVGIAAKDVLEFSVEKRLEAKYPPKKK